MKIYKQSEIVKFIVDYCREYELDDKNVEATLDEIAEQVKEETGIV